MNSIFYFAGYAIAIASVLVHNFYLGLAISVAGGVAMCVYDIMGFH